jgi:Holliday junction DNA helicase RuvA
MGAIAAADAARFQAVPGIGKRTAERIIVELREKVAGAVADEIVVSRAPNDPRAIAREGLVGLGYAPQEADALLDEVDGDTPEDLIAGALRAAR